MADMRTRSIFHELFLASVLGAVGPLEPWVTDRLAALLVEETVLAGTCVYSAGEPPDFFYFVRAGDVSLLRAGSPVEVVHGPSVFGMLDAILERPRSHSAYSTAPLELLKVSIDGWLELLEDSFELARLAVLRLARSVAVLEEQSWKAGRSHLLAAPLVLETGGPSLDLVDRLTVLMRTTLLRGAGTQPICDLASVCTERALAAGERLFAYDAPADAIFVVARGSIAASRSRPLASWVGGAGESVCGTIAFAGMTSAWEAHAITRARVLTFSVDDWLDILEENFEMVRATLVSLATEHENLRGMR
jgi:CRP-like cAMP-binding protein